MTTTLRPEGPETPTAAGGRTRRWRILSNGHPVGALRTTADPLGSQLGGKISELEVTEGRGRGRGTFGGLAAEEVLRTWGCTRVDVNIPESAPTARALAVTLGYVERALIMSKQLVAAPGLPAGVGVRPFDRPAELQAWLHRSTERYVRWLVNSGLTEEQARARAAGGPENLLPLGADTPGVVLGHLFGADAAEGSYGSLWVQLRVRDLPNGEPLAWVMMVEVPPARRGQGHGRTLMLLAERECLAVGVRNVGLNVFPGNQNAIRLYTSLGYRVTERVYGKQL
ncbi:GNAT family N-acetyltransferase [Streptomyces sp. 1331.2]|uniref:GNAT family N-acetyltransferase n=1 Tax=Streptomyces sp. 1331.2 TaxID=1938835 RepID=UPI000BD12959|nr:GNAT family N-acetyltransferase [Streptomyces sp. 1331.2]SOB85073.1 Acetyltransferase (GNAT) family protein [Streptomyces sp. 1331.2]